MKNIGGSRVRILRIALQEAVRAGDTQAAKRLTARLAELLTHQAGASPAQRSVAVH